MISPIDSLRGQSGFSEIYANIDILAAQPLFVMKFSPFTLKITQIAIMFKLFSNLIPIRENLPPNLNKGFIEPPCTEPGDDLYFELDTDVRPEVWITTL